MEHPPNRRRAVAWGALVVAGAMTTAACSGRVEAMSVGAGPGPIDERPAIPGRAGGTVGAVGTMLNALVMEPELTDPVDTRWASSSTPEALAREVVASGGAAWPEAQLSAFASFALADASLIATAVALAAVAAGEVVPGRDPGCEGVEEWAGLKHRWQLSVDRVELAALVEWFDGCVDGPAPETQIG